MNRSETKLSEFKINLKIRLRKDLAHMLRGIVQKTLVTHRHKKLIALLIAYREKAGLTQSQLAEQLGEYQSFVARLESGERRIDVIEFMRIAEILGIDEGRLLKQLKPIAG